MRRPIRLGTFATSTTARFGVRSSGFGGSAVPVDPQPSFAWTVGGVPLGAPNGNVNVPVDGKAFTLEYTIDPAVFELTLTSRGGERYETPAVVTVTGDGTTTSATAVFTAQGWIEGIDPDDAQKLGDCISRITQRYRRVPCPRRSACRRPSRRGATWRRADWPNRPG
jgi:hypothetical protein